MNAPARSEHLVFQDENLPEIKSLSPDGERLYSSGPAGDAALCWLADQSRDAELQPVTVPVLKLNSSATKRIADWAGFNKEARQGLHDMEMRDAVSTRFLFYSPLFPNSPPVAMAGLFRITRMLPGLVSGRIDEYYQFTDKDLADARLMTADADRLYAAGRIGDQVLSYLQQQQDSKEYCKNFPIPSIDITGESWQEIPSAVVYQRMARQGLPNNEARHSVAVELRFYSRGTPRCAPVRMAGIVRIGAMLTKSEDEAHG